jgi:hypothetical protein
VGELSEWAKRRGLKASEGGSWSDPVAYSIIKQAINKDGALLSLSPSVVYFVYCGCSYVVCVAWAKVWKYGAVWVFVVDVF